MIARDIPEVNVFAIGDTALNTSAPVCHGAKTSIGIGNELIIVLASWHFSSSETRANLKRFGGGDRKHPMGERGFEFVEDRLS